MFAFFKSATLWIAGGMFLLVALVAAGYRLLDRQQALKPESVPQKITIAYAKLPYAALAQIAQMKGYYGKEGLQVTPLVFPYGKLALEAVLNGDADCATVAETPAMLALMNGADLILLATIQVSRQSHGIVARRDRGIATPLSLRGKRVAVGHGTSGHFFLDSFLAAQGVPRDGLTVVHLEPEKMPDALARGTIDAISTWMPFLAQAHQQLGQRAVSFFDDDVYTLTFHIVARRDFARNPEKVQKLLRALLHAEQFCRDDPQGAQRLMAEFNKIPSAEVEAMWNNSTFALSLDQRLVLALEDESEWAIRNGLTKRKTIPDYLDFIYLDGLRSVKPDAVTILK